MAVVSESSTGILLRRKNSKDDFLLPGNGLREGELVYALNEDVFGYIKDPSNNSIINWFNAQDEIPSGGLAGQVLGKNSNVDGDVAWIDVASGGGGELIKVTENSVTGYALADDDRTNKGAIGQGAIDLSFYEQIGDIV